MDIKSFVETNSKPLLFGFLGVAVIAGVAWWYFFYDMRLTVMPTPASASVTIDGVDVSGQKDVKLKPGTHDVKVTLNDYIPFEQTVKASSDKYSTMSISLNTLPHIQMVATGSIDSLSYDATNNQLYYINHTATDAERVILTSTKSSTGATNTVPKPQILTPGTLNNVDAWLWSPDYSVGLFEHGSTWSLYDFARFDLLNQKQTDWPASIGSVSWNPASATQLIHYFAPSSDNQTLIHTDPLHQTSDIYFNFRDSGITNPTVRWVGDGSDAVLQSQEGRLWRFVVYTKTVAPITQSETVADALPSPDGKTILVRDTTNHEFLIGIDGKNKQTVSFQVPLDQITWQSDSKALWVVDTASGSLSVNKYDLASKNETSYDVAKNETVGTVSGVVITQDQSALAIAGAGGLALVPITPTQYSAVPLK